MSAKTNPADRLDALALQIASWNSAMDMTLFEKAEAFLREAERAGYLRAREEANREIEALRREHRTGVCKSGCSYDIACGIAQRHIRSLKP